MPELICIDASGYRHRVTWDDAPAAFYLELAPVYSAGVPQTMSEAKRPKPTLPKRQRGTPARRFELVGPGPVPDQYIYEEV